jgi:hypothetical protein
LLGIERLRMYMHVVEEKEEDGRVQVVLVG